ncbi:putative ester cyclase [Pseudoduganella flava]|uniref:Ester cyclase n=1 Tax=Pseudoduganella flava TaxID=871742 RepID=A0A562PW83_9BURK|nr:ester cyclase [Pseudoduganella flava]QGZ39755.1 ester cyclase [Pseudoduganella flava]TWI48667.1 putative ester cyclase [Pseudoduganella flava]
MTSTNHIAAGTIAALAFAFATTATATAAVHVGGAPDPVVQAARTYAQFWNTGDPALARAALAPGFIDRTLPPGRAQGPDGPLQASRTFRAAVPDLRAEATDIVAEGDRVAVRLHFTGHFTGTFDGRQGHGEPIDFQAFDLYRVKNGRIAENWHLEDNLTLLRQLGAR